LRSILGAFLFAGDDVFKTVSVLSGGEKARLAIAKMLLKPANLILMDEPTNHLDIASREVLTDALEEYNGTLCFITHDRLLINQVANKIIEVKDGNLTVYLGDYDYYTEKREEREAAVASASGNKSKAAGDDAKRRKNDEALLRNNYFKKSKPLKNEIEKVETEIFKLEEEKTALEALYTDETKCSDGAAVVEATKRHQQVLERIKALEGRWEELSLQDEDMKRVLSEALNSL
jgi:ATP-binding cassette subfamily F protein 3